MKTHLSLSLSIIALTSLTSPLAADELSASQEKWLADYESHPHLPEPEEQLLNTDEEPDLEAEGFIDLYNGEDLTGWTSLGGDCEFEAKGEVIVGTSVAESPNTYLATDQGFFTDFIFTVEVKRDVDSSTGVMFRAGANPGEGEDEGTETVFGPKAEMEAFSKERFWSGGIYRQAAGGWAYPMWLEAHKEVRESMVADEWNRLTIKAEGETVKTWINGLPAAHWENDEFPAGFFALEIHGGSEGTVHFRNIKLLLLNVETEELETEEVIKAVAVPKA